MKIKLGFISNSSSSSFTISIDKLHEYQIEMINDYKNIAEKIGMQHVDSYWSINEESNKIVGWTLIDNFDMKYFLTEICKINSKDIRWERL